MESPVLMEPWARHALSAALRAFRLRKEDGTVYHIAVTEHGPTCDCPDWTFHRDGIDPAGCKHIKALNAVGEAFFPVQPLVFIELGQQRPPDFQPYTLLFPFQQPAAAGRV